MTTGDEAQLAQQFAQQAAQRAAEQLAMLTRGLGTRYEILREIGKGGMATVFLARDLRTPRDVAIKVLRPELSAAVSAQRFLREIDVIASFQHPNIVPLFDSGDVDGVPFYVMPYIEGASLREIVQQKTQLSLEEAVEFARQIALAIDYAHVRGVVHRDIKPQNVLVSHGQALVADFGLARAMAASDADALTSSGMAVGSLYYMSPEQGLGVRDIDGRTDIYSLGCVVYELLIGEPPFTGVTPQAVIARHSREAVQDMRVVRDTIPRGMERAVRKALAKVPADRYQTATAFATALKASLLEEPTTWTKPPTRFVGIVAFAALIASLAIVGTLVARRYMSGANTVVASGARFAILPFRFTGTVDSTALTAAGLAERLTAKLAGADVADAIDPTLVLRQWRSLGVPAQNRSLQDEVAVARKLGADVILVGTVQGTRTNITVGGSLVSGDDGATIARIGEVSGSVDSLGPLLDRFAIALLLQRAGEGWRRPNEPPSGRLDAVRPFVAGLHAYRRGRYEAAAIQFERAIQVDPQFALARLRLGMVHTAAGDLESAWQAFDKAWIDRAKLTREDAHLLDAVVSERYPIVSSYASQLAKLEWLADSVPDEWEGAYELGDMLLHWGALLGKELPVARARAAFESALSRDSAFAPALEHLIDLAAVSGDLKRLDLLVRRYLGVNAGADHETYVRWRFAAATGDSLARNAIVRGVGTLRRGVLEQIVGIAQLDGVGLNDAAAAAAELRRRARSDQDVWWTTLLTRELALNRGRPGDVPTAKVPGFFSVPLDEFFRVLGALYWNDDTTNAAHLISTWRQDANHAIAAGARLTSPPFMKTCTVGLWDMVNRGPGILPSALQRLRETSGADARVSTNYIPLCAATLDAGLAAQAQRPDAGILLESLDSLLRSGPVTNAYIRLAARVTIADVREQHGDIAGALKAVRERAYHHLTFGTAGLSMLLLREARLAAKAGDHAGAIRAYQHFLALFASAEPPYNKQRARAQAELDSLKRSGTS